MERKDQQSDEQLLLLIAEDEDFDSVEDWLESPTGQEALYGTLGLGICTDCASVTDQVEGDAQHNWCPVCHANAVVSASWLVLSTQP